MYENMSSLNLLGLNEILASGKLTVGQSTAIKDKTGTQEFAALLSSFTTQDKSGEVDGWLGNAGITMPAGRSLQQLFLDAMLRSFSQDDTPKTTATGLTAEVVPPAGVSTPPTTPVDTSTRSTTSTSPTRSQQEVVQTVGLENAELLSKISNATSMDQRLKYGTEMRDKIVTALRTAGYTVENSSSIDKISINGQMIDVLQNLKTLGTNSRVQYLEVQNGGASGATNEIAAAILTAAQKSVDVLMQLRATTDPSERQKLAQTIRTQIVETLNAKGYNTTGVFGSADKITVNGETYDFLSGLHANNNQTQFQALKV